MENLNDLLMTSMTVGVTSFNCDERTGDGQVTLVEDPASQTDTVEYIVCQDGCTGEEYYIPFEDQGSTEVVVIYQECKQDDLDSTSVPQGPASPGQDVGTKEDSAPVLSKDSQYVCPVCEDGFQKPSQLKRHVRIHNEAETNEHPYSKSQEKPFTCPECKTTFARPYNLRRHMQTHSDDRPHSCHACGLNFARLWTLKVHLRTHLSNADKKKNQHFQCLDCQKQFWNITALKRHVTTCRWLPRKDDANKKQVSSCGQRTKGKQIVVYTCSICNASFGRKFQLDKHRKLCKSDEQVKSHSEKAAPLSDSSLNTKEPYMCGHCEASFSEILQLRDHVDTCKKSAGDNTLNVEKKLDEWKCASCLSEFATADLLVDHVRKGNFHEAAVICTVNKCPVWGCAKKYASSRKLELHLVRDHNMGSQGEDPNRKDNVKWGCHQCSILFDTVDELDKHNRDAHSRKRPVLHSKKKKYPCDICGQILLSNYGYKCHVRAHEVKSIKCPLCGSSFVREFNLRRHMRKQHRFNDNKLAKLAKQQMAEKPTEVDTSSETEILALDSNGPEIVNEDPKTAG